MQRKSLSAIEASLNIGSGFILSLIVWRVIGPWFGYDVPLDKNLGITSIFTIVSLSRSYAWRRLFTRLDPWLNEKLGEKE